MKNIVFGALTASTIIAVAGSARGQTEIDQIEGRFERTRAPLSQSGRVIPEFDPLNPPPAAGTITFTLPALANPTGGDVEAGSATFESVSPFMFQITQQSDRAVINWDSFSIGAGETTRFVLPGSDSVTLNRDFSGNPSEIFGHLESNGNLFLVNSNGILFGRNSTVDGCGTL